MMECNNAKRINETIYTKDFINEYLGHEFCNFQLLADSNPSYKFDSIMEEIFMNDINVDEIGLVTIDEECSKWLYENGLENTEENHFLYASQVTDDKMRELWTKHKLNLQYELKYIPVISHKTSNEFCSGNIKLSDTCITNINNDVANHLNCDPNDIFILPNAYRLDYILKYNNKLYKYALNTLENDQPENLPVGLYKQQNNIDVIERYIAVFIRTNIDCIRNVHTFNNDSDKSSYGYAYNNSTITELNKDFSYNEVNLASTLVSLDSIEGYSEEFYESFKDMSLECIN